MYEGRDNRIFQRIIGEFAVRYSPQGSNEEFCSTTKDISGGGIRMSLFKGLNPGTILDIEIFGSDANINAKCRGRIVWLHQGIEQPFEAGIQFVDSKLLYIGRLIEHLENQNIQVTTK